MARGYRWFSVPRFIRERLRPRKLRAMKRSQSDRLHGDDAVPGELDEPAEVYITVTYEPRRVRSINRRYVAVSIAMLAITAGLALTLASAGTIGGDRAAPGLASASTASHGSSGLTLDPDGDHDNASRLLNDADDRQQRRTQARFAGARSEQGR
jgi:hypothetical protein